MNTLSKKDLTKLSFVRPKPGNNVIDIAGKMAYRANFYNTRVTCVFNDVQFTVNPGMNWEDGFNLWKEEMDRQDRQWQKSMKAEVARRDQLDMQIKHQKRLNHVYDVIRTGNLSVPFWKFIGFKLAIKKHSSSNLDRLVIEYALAWGIEMQKAMKNGAKLADVADQLSHDVDNGMSGFSHGLAVAFLCRYWKHGEELRRWHNRQYGVSDDESKTHKGKVVNPAIIRISSKQ